MLKKISSVIIAAMLLVTFGCTANESGQTSADDVNKMIAQAEASRKKAKSVGGEWRDIGKFLKKAKKALKKGDNNKAMKLAKKADTQGKMGYQQMMDQKNFRMPEYFKF